jgi:hypothetical protein
MTDAQALFALRFALAAGTLAWTLAIDGMPDATARRITLVWLAFVGTLALLAWHRWGSAERPRRRSRPPRS